jgi:hypothetical protein
VDEPGRSLSRDLVLEAPGEKSERQLDLLIERQHARRVQSEGERSEEEAWKESERLAALKRHRQLCSEWVEHHQRMLAGHKVSASILEAHHRGEIARYRKMLDECTPAKGAA